MEVYAFCRESAMHACMKRIRCGAYSKVHRKLAVCEII